MLHTAQAGVTAGGELQRVGAAVFAFAAEVVQIVSTVTAIAGEI